MADIHAGIREVCQGEVIELPRRDGREQHFVIESGEDLLRLSQWASQHDYYFCTVVANDERLLEDHIFKLYYLFSAPDGFLVTLEYPLNDPLHPTEYPSIRASFPSVEPLEHRLYDTFGLSPHTGEVHSGSLLHTPYPPEYYPLRQGRTRDKLEERARAYCPPTRSASAMEMPGGMLAMPVGPIHAGVIEAGCFQFHLAGEVIEEVRIRLGYKHRGIEKLFQTSYTLERGHELAERVSGDASFAHSTAFCHAVESLAGVEVPVAARCWRGLLLELERFYNHAGDIAALVHDMAFDLLASELAVVREQALRLNQRVCGHRLLRGVNVPGGVHLPRLPDLSEVQRTIETLASRLLDLGKLVLEMPACRERMLNTGMLTCDEARTGGATGMVARASGLWQHDFRLRHPCGVYAIPTLALADELRRTVVLSDDDLPSGVHRRVPIYRSDLQGDVFARLALRVAEVETSVHLLTRLVAALRQKGGRSEPLVAPLEKLLRAVPNFEYGIGYAESWRGEVIYWLMKGPRNTIFRCEPRDPSLFNWAAMRQAIIRKPDPRDPAGRRYLENILADFPLINKSFNLSYAGHDL